MLSKKKDLFAPLRESPMKLVLILLLKYLGVWLDENLTFDFHLSITCKKISKALFSHLSTTTWYTPSSYIDSPVYSSSSTEILTICSNSIYDVFVQSKDLNIIPTLHCSNFIFLKNFSHFLTLLLNKF